VERSYAHSVGAYRSTRLLGLYLSWFVAVAGGIKDEDDRATSRQLSFNSTQEVGLMCNKCDDLGFTNEVVRRFTIFKDGVKSDDVEWGSVACDCEWGDAWMDRQKRIDVDFAYRMNDFVDKYVTTNRKYNALVTAYLSGTRYYENTDGNL
jgi:hypothetical protein